MAKAYKKHINPDIILSKGVFNYSKGYGSAYEVIVGELYLKEGLEAAKIFIHKTLLSDFVLAANQPAST